MVTANQAYSMWIAQLKQHQKRDGLHTVSSTVNVVTHEEVVRVRNVTADPE